MRKFFKRVSLCMGVLLAATICTVGYLDYTLPENYYVSQGNMPYISCGVNVVGEATENQGEMALKLFGVIPIKNATVTESQAPLLIPGGTPVGIKILTDGVMVVSINEVSRGVCPCKEAGLTEGDCIKTANGQRITSSSQLSDIIAESEGKPIYLTVEQDGKDRNILLRAVKTDSGYKAGLSIRDSSAGVGTLTFVDPQSGIYGALGHQISDFDTGKLMPLATGEVVPAAITDCDKGKPGSPGELHGMFVSNTPIGSIEINCDRGIFGIMTKRPQGEAIPMAFKSEVMAGKASIITTVDGTTPKEYEIEIEKITLSSAAGTKNMVIRVTDAELLEKTGGIVQGMSGSPIIQNGKLVGAVTHV